MRSSHMNSVPTSDRGAGLLHYLVVDLERSFHALASNLLHDHLRADQSRRTDSPAGILPIWSHCIPRRLHWAPLRDARGWQWPHSATAPAAASTNGQIPATDGLGCHHKWSNDGRLLRGHY